MKLFHIEPRPIPHTLSSLLLSTFLLLFFQFITHLSRAPGASIVLHVAKIELGKLLFFIRSSIHSSLPNHFYPWFVCTNHQCCHGDSTATETLHDLEFNKFMQQHNGLVFYATKQWIGWGIPCSFL